MDINIAKIPNVVATCIVLHNYCEMHGDECRPEWMQTDNQRVNEISLNLQQSVCTDTQRKTGSEI